MTTATATITPVLLLLRIYVFLPTAPGVAIEVDDGKVDAVATKGNDVKIAAKDDIDDIMSGDVDIAADDVKDVSVDKIDVVDDLDVDKSNVDVASRMSVLITLMFLLVMLILMTVISIKLMLILMVTLMMQAVYL